jgi:hypothetical protein
MRKSVRAGLLVVGAAGIVGTFAAGAPASPGGYLCNVDRNTYVYDRPGGHRIYTIPKGGGFRLHSYTLDYWYGHGNGHSDGYIRDDGRLYNC